MQASDLVLGVDGGGTKTVAWIARRERSGNAQVIGRGRSESSNCRSVGYAQATSNLDRAIDLAFRDAGQAATPVASACLALAGADRPVEREQFRAWAGERNVADKLIITNDAMPVLYAASGSGIGIALLSGTGSVAVGRNSNGDTARCGGWGSLLGDEGSGYQIALAALRASVRAADGRGEPTTLLSKVMTHFQVDEASELIPVIYSSDTNRSIIANLTPLVFQSSAQGDKVATVIFERAAADLADMVATLANRLKLVERPVALGISGGVLLHQENLVEEICKLLIKSALEVTVTRVNDPVAGCLQLASASLADR